MKTPVHLAASLILAAMLYPVFKWKVFLIVVGGVAVDIDHYFWYIRKHRNFNLFSCYRFFTVDEEKNNWRGITGIMLIFHTIEFLLLMVALSFYNEPALILTIGLLSHYLLDGIFNYTVTKRIVLNHSAVSWIIKNFK